MKNKRMIVGILFLGLAAQTTILTRAQDLAPPLESPPSPSDLPTDGYFWFNDAGDKADCVSTSCSPCPTVYGYAEALFLQRTNCSKDQPIIVQSIDGIPVETFLSASDLNFGFDPAMRVVLGHRLNNGWALEGQYFGLCDASASEFVTAPDQGTNLTFPPGGLGDVNVPSDFDWVRADYSSSIHSGELNLVCCCDCCNPCGKGKGDPADCNLYCRTFEWFVGFRYFNLREHLRIYGEREQATETGTGIESSVYDLRTSNNLYGPQVGARVRRWGRKLGWEATGKAGIFGSDTQQEQYVTDYPDGFEVRPLTSASDNGVAFVGELNFTGIYRLNEAWNLRAGYNLMFISGVALAPDQLDFSGDIGAGNQISSSGGVFLHGVSCGLEARW